MINITRNHTRCTTKEHCNPGNHGNMDNAQKHGSLDDPDTDVKTVNHEDHEQDTCNGHTTDNDNGNATDTEGNA